MRKTQFSNFFNSKTHKSVFQLCFCYSSVLGKWTRVSVFRVPGHCVKVSELYPEVCVIPKDSGNHVLLEDLFLVRLLLMQFTVWSYGRIYICLFTMLLSMLRAAMVDITYAVICLFRRKFLMFWKNLLQNLVSLRIYRICLVNILVQNVQWLK